MMAVSTRVVVLLRDRMTIKITVVAVAATDADSRIEQKMIDGGVVFGTEMRCY